MSQRWNGIVLWSISLFVPGLLHAETYIVPPSPDVQFVLQSRLIEAQPGDVIQLELAASPSGLGLDVNCAHCHQPSGSARTTGLDLRISQTESAKYEY